jgi:hypothetical protein
MSLTWKLGISPDAESAFDRATREHDYYGRNAESALRYKTMSTDGKEAVRGIWIHKDTQQIANVIVFGIIKSAEVGPYGNQFNAPESSWDVRIRL